jgi:hypothetical protein
MQCKKCRAELPKNAKFCPQCSTPVPQRTGLQIDQKVGAVKGSVAGLAAADGATTVGLDADISMDIGTVEPGGAVVGAALGGPGGHVHVGGQQSYGDVYSGDFRGAILNVRSTLANVTQSIDRITGADQSTKEDLKELVDQLTATLEKVPPDRAEDAEAVATLTESVVDQVTAEKPNKALLQITGDGLKKAAENIADVLPTVLGIATRIVAAVAGLGL